MNSDFSLSKISPRLTHERLKGYKQLLTGQLTILFLFLVIYQLFSEYPFAHWQQFMVAIVGIIMLGMNYLTYELIKDLTENNLVQFIILGLLFTAVTLGIITGLGIVDHRSVLYYAMSLATMACSFVAFTILLYYMIYDIFNEKHEVAYRLWGSASIYTLIGATFGQLYSLIAIALPTQFGFSETIDLFNFIPCYNFSFYILAGIDSPFENFGLLITNIAVVESVISNLFIVLVVGRLLSK